MPVGNIRNVFFLKSSIMTVLSVIWKRVLTRFITVPVNIHTQSHFWFMATEDLFDQRTVDEHGHV